MSDDASIGRQLAEVLQTVLERESAERDVRRVMDGESGIDDRLWRILMQDLEIGDIATPRALDGIGTWSMLCLAAEQLGAALAAVPFFSSLVLCLPLLTDDATDGQAVELSRHLITGERRGTLALTGLSTPFSDWGGGVDARRAGDGRAWRLNGRKGWVVDAMTADVAVVTARTDEGLGLFVVDLDAEPGSVSRLGLETLDPTRRLGAVRLTDAPACALALGTAAEERLRCHLARTWTALAAEQLGGADRALAMTVEYAKARIQFGRAIGSFQAVKHRLADMAVLVENMRAAVWRGGQAVDSEQADALVTAAAVRSYCSDAFVEIANEMLQLHGGVGFTWEHPAHLYFKRARSSAQLLGDPATVRALADQLDGGRLARS